MRRLLLLTAMILYLPGCAPVISRDSLSLVDRRASFAELKGNPDQYRGKYFLLGGGIAAVRNTNEGGEIEVVQFRTDDDGKITDTVNTEGRFLARSRGFIDPAVYKAGLLITIVGEVQGKIRMRLGEVDYTYPVLSIREIHLWKPEESQAPPGFTFGIGVGTIFH